MNRMSIEEAASLLRFSQCMYVFLRAWQSDWKKQSNDLLEEYKKAQRFREAAQIEGIGMIIELALSTGIGTALFIGSETTKDLDARTPPKN